MLPQSFKSTAHSFWYHRSANQPAQEWSGDYYNPEEAEVWHVESYPDCNSEALFLALRLPPPGKTKQGRRDLEVQTSHVLLIWYKLSSIKGGNVASVLPRSSCFALTAGSSEIACSCALFACWLLDFSAEGHIQVWGCLFSRAACDHTCLG